jgi:hypothetical protein
MLRKWLMWSLFGRLRLAKNAEKRTTRIIREARTQQRPDRLDKSINRPFPTATTFAALELGDQSVALIV